MRTSGFSNVAGIVAAPLLLILAGSTTPVAQDGTESWKAVASSLSEEVQALREELRVAKAQIQILKSTVDTVAAQSAAQAGLALAKQGEPGFGQTRSWQGLEASAAGAPTARADDPDGVSYAVRLEGPDASASAAGAGGSAAAEADQQVAALTDAAPASDQLISEVHFNPGSADLTPGGRSKTAQAAESIKAMEGGKIRVVGYTDTTGGSGYNKHLALLRAGSIAGLLESLGVSRDRIEVVGRGEEGTPVPTDDQVSEPLNRCAGIYVLAGSTN